MLHSHQLTEKEMKGHQLQQELTHEQAVTREKESEVHKLQQKLENEQAASREKLTHEQAVSRLAHGDLLAAKMREEESQQLVVKLKEEVSEHKAAIASCIVFMITID